MPEPQVRTPKDARRAAVEYMRKLRELRRAVQRYPDAELILSIDLKRLGLPTHKLTAIGLAKRLFRLAVTHGVKLEIDSRTIPITTDFIDVVKALMRLGNNFRVVAAPRKHRTAELSHVCSVRGIEYQERPPRSQ